TLIEESGTLTATGTSIGADSGIGMATVLYVLKHTPNHGPVRAIFTTDGEKGMTGAENLKAKYLEGDFLINLAWDSDHTVGLGSPGTASYEMAHKIEWAPPQNAIPYLLTLSGLKGGDADRDMGKGGANAIKTIGEVLANAQGKGILFELAGFNGGVSGDTIPASASVLIVINESDEKKMQAVVNDAMDAFESAYGDVEENYSFTYEKTEMPDKVVSFEDNGSIISFIYGIIDGVQTRSEAYGDVVESASNIGMVSTATGSFLCQVSVASNSDAKMYTITSAHEAISGMSGMQYTYHSGIPRWRDHPKSVLYKAVRKIHSDLFGDNISGSIVYDKMECGWFVKKNPKLQVVSIGPMIKNAGLPNEALVKDSVTEPAKTVMGFLEQVKQIDR
nr:M20/M25/M40 family metallo-hydrolase [Bacillota bacterium]